MTRQLKWAFSVLVIVIVGFAALQIYLHIDRKNFDKNLNSGPKVKHEPPTTPNIIFSDEKPADVPGFKWVRHNDHWDKVPIDSPNEPIEHPPVQNAEVPNENPQQKFEPVIIDGVGDLNEWLNYFESFGDDPSLDELYEREFGKKVIQYGVSKRSFDDKNASPEESDLSRKINDKITELGYIKNDKKAAAKKKHEEWRRANIKYDRSPILVGPLPTLDAEEEGDDQ